MQPDSSSDALSLLSIEKKVDLLVSLVPRLTDDITFVKETLYQVSKNFDQLSCYFVQRMSGVENELQQLTTSLNRSRQHNQIKPHRQTSSGRQLDLAPFRDALTKYFSDQRDMGDIDDEVLTTILERARREGLDLSVDPDRIVVLAIQYRAQLLADGV
ncbi:hypothetical protein KIPB_002323 [Kipferlia bialata]|uniref:Uncharacterized protein n=1 Tax=Kipferlia bialata TaxID=797122 RepID=A0A391NJA0_9EUKA|nr:hypothetical protein KIPB_002323 [Kipferlia bialata]|eukprot:g2323.t1